MSDDSIKAIQDRMKAVRRELGNDLATSARDITNWRRYVRSNPWICLGGAAVLGYLLVPQKTPKVRLDPSELRSLLKEKGATAILPQAQPGVATRLSRMLASNVGGLLLRGAMAYATAKMAAAKAESETRENAPW